MANSNFAQKWLKIFAVLSLLLASFSPALLIIKSQAATLGVGTLAPGTSWDTGNHTYSSGQLGNSSSYVAGNNQGQAVVNGNWFNLVNNTPSTVGYAVFQGALSTSSLSTNAAFSMSATIKLENTSGGKWSDIGDAIGFILTPSSASQLAANVQTAQASAQGLGIQGLPNSYFLGRDLYSNLGDSFNNIDGVPGVLGTGWQSGGGDVITIRNTSATGALNAASYPSGTTTNTQDGQAWCEAEDNGYVAGVSTGRASTAQEPVSMSWTPDATNTAAAGYNSGTLTFNLIAQTISNNALLFASSVNGGTAGYTITTHCSLSNTVSLGFIAGTGANYGNLSVSLNTTNATVAVPRGTQTVLANYVRSTDGAPIQGFNQQSTILANVNDTIAVLAPSSTATSPATPGLADTYNYVAPAAPAGYSYLSSKSVQVQNYDNSATNPNVLNLQYQPLPQSGQVSYAWADNTPGYNGNPGKLQAELPANQSLSGLTGDALSFSVNIPAGYSVANVVGPDGKSYDSLAAAQAANPYFVDSSVNNNAFKITLAAQQQTVSFKVNVSAGEDAPAAPDTQTITTGLTGAMISASDVSKVQSWYDDWLKGNTGWFTSSYSDPTGSQYNDINAKLQDAVNGFSSYILADSNLYQASVAYSGSISLDAANSINFGNHTISPAIQSYTGKLDKAVVVNDNRASSQRSGWTVTVAEQTPLTQQNVPNGSVLNNAVSYKNQVLSSTPIVLMSLDQGVAGTTTVLPASSQDFTLKMLIEAQTNGANFQGTLIWNLSVGP